MVGVPRVAFDAWLKTDPFNDPNAPAGPMFMAEYVSADAQQADRYEAKAADLIAAGETANETSDSYVLFTVVFATVLFLAAVPNASSGASPGSASWPSGDRCSPSGWSVSCSCQSRRD